MTREKSNFSILDAKNVNFERVVERLLEEEKNLRKKVFETAYCILREYGIELDEEELPNFLLLMGWVGFKNLKSRLIKEPSKLMYKDSIKAD